MSGRGRSGVSRNPGRGRRRTFGRKRFPKDREWIERRGRRKKGETKAEIRRALRKDVLAALAHIAAYNDPGENPERLDHLVRAIECLERAIETRPGQHLLRKQRELCREESESRLMGRGGGTIEVVLNEMIG